MALGIWSRLQSLIFGSAIGAAAAEAIAPSLEPARQHAWQQNQNKILDPRAVAELVTQGGTDLDTAADIAARNGFDRDKFKALVYLALEAPPYSEVLDLWRRNQTRPASEQLSEEQVDHALAKAQIEQQYWPALKELVNARLSPQELALAIVRGLIPDPGILPVAPPTEAGSVPSFPTFPVDALAEAAASGFDKERLSVLVGTMGRPMPVNEAARAVFRTIIERVDFDRAIAEGDIRNEWRDALFDVAREILSATQYAESHLRGYTPDIETMFANMAKHGMSREDAELLFLNQGRPLALHQITTGLARGGSYNGPTDQIPQVYLDAVRQSNVKPPYYNLDYANRYSYPSAFFFRLLATTGAIDQAEAEQAFLELGWSPKWAKLVAQSLAPKVKTSVDPLVKSALTKFVTALHKAYVGGATNDTDALKWLSDAGVAADTASAMLDLWRLEYQLEQSALPPA